MVKRAIDECGRAAAAGFVFVGILAFFVARRCHPGFSDVFWGYELMKRLEAMPNEWKDSGSML